MPLDTLVVSRALAACVTYVGGVARVGCVTRVGGVACVDGVTCVGGVATQRRRGATGYVGGVARCYTGSVVNAMRCVAVIRSRILRHIESEPTCETITSPCTPDRTFSSCAQLEIPRPSKVETDREVAQKLTTCTPRSNSNNPRYTLIPIQS